MVRKKAREIWFLCRQYNAQEALDMGLVNTVVPYADLEKETVRWCREMLRNSPIALRCLKAALNADCDGQSGLQELAGNATMLFYMTEEGQEGRNAFNEKTRTRLQQIQTQSLILIIRSAVRNQCVFNRLIMIYLDPYSYFRIILCPV